MRRLRDQGYGLRFAIEPKPNEPRGDIFLPTVGHALHFITTLEHPEMVGVNPEVAHETMAGLSFVHGGLRRRCGPESCSTSTSTASASGASTRTTGSAPRTSRRHSCSCTCSRPSGYEGPRHFDAHAYRSEDADGVWEFAAGCMRTYLALAAKSRQFLSSPRIQAAREAARVDELAEPSVGAYSSDAAAALLEEGHDLGALAGHGYGAERLDQRLVELLLGAG